MINPTGDGSVSVADSNQAAIKIFKRAKIVARILTENGQPVTPPDEAILDDVEWERWQVCIEIVKALDQT